MNRMNQVLLVLHFLGLAMGFSVSFANMVMAGLIVKAGPQEKAVLGRFPPVMSRVGRVGLALLWLSGLTLLYTKWGGLASLPWQFHAKLTAVVCLTIAVTWIHRLERAVQAGDRAAAERIATVGKMTMLFGIAAVVFAVLTFD